LKVQALNLPGPVGLIGRQQPNHQPNQLTGCQDKGPLILVLGHFVIFAVIISFVLSVAHPNGVGGFTKVVMQIAIAIADEERMFSLELIRLRLTPHQASEFGHFGLVEIKTFQGANLGDDAGREDRADTGNGLEGVRDRFELVSNGCFEPLLIALQAQ
jgi:hypothetical protein